MQPTTLIWFRRNLRVADNAALHTALQRGLPVAGIWISEEGRTNPRQALFLHRSAAELHQALAACGIPLYGLQGNAEQLVSEWADALHAAAVVADEAYTPSELWADNRIWHALDKKNIPFIRVNDRSIFAKSELTDRYGMPYRTFPEYRQAWLQAYAQRFRYKQPVSYTAADGILQTALDGLPPFPANLYTPSIVVQHKGGEAAGEKQWAQFAAEIGFYPLQKDFPARKGTGQISAYLTAGCLSARSLAAQAWQQQHRAWLDTLIRRDFHLQTAFHMPSANQEPADHPVSSRYLERWQAGQTGFPLIDAAMRALKRSGWLHPALREAVALFWCGTLKQPWQSGAAWFAAQLTDYEPAANQGNWQEACAQTAPPPLYWAQKLDPDGTFVRRHLPELAHLPSELVHTPHLAGANADTHGYPPPMIKV
ncbi:FAD-binding domain-containing protein [Neisseria animalis]|uniref:Deoxyribodipyrimidine photo-lyase n=1 Tax=Neisseria animalis TaxID=492 RepID=A0A5P3MSK6_NEIAN|nr:deoxyribodipyrimidine photo-lyase [Neisseria animalis]QEY24075.1 deoxyribodipyrimidine photo-lyase [Neisseria animalis]ROW32643.1 deoxyribodipyrimidine photo-lyase [Neisseria animalis]VEE06220.1 deoxyribodopyrimidine photolyase [Neisseria animalis]